MLGSECKGDRESDEVIVAKKVGNATGAKYLCCSELFQQRKAWRNDKNANKCARPERKDIQ